MKSNLLLRTLALAVCMIPNVVSAQRPDIVTGEYELPLNDAISILQLKEELVIKAKATALQNKYGTSVMKIENMILSESSEIALEENFWSVTETQSRGTWLCDRTTPVFTNLSREDGTSIMKVTVSGYAIPALKKQTDVQAAILSCPEPTCDAFVYPENSLFHIFFQSSVKGYLLVFVEDMTEQRVYGIGKENVVLYFPVKPHTPLMYPDPASSMAYTNMKFTLSDGATASQHIFRFLLMEHQSRLPAAMNITNVCDSEEFRQWLMKVVLGNELLALETIAVTVIK